MPFSLHLVVTVMSVVLLTLAVPVLAQAPRPERPYRGLFGGRTGETTQSLSATVSLSGGYDNNLAADVRGSDRPRATDLNTTFRGGVGQATTGLSYALVSGRVNIGAGAGTAVSYYPTLAGSFLPTYNARFDTSVDVGGGLSMIGRAVYQPYSLRSALVNVLDQTAGPAAGVAVDLLASREHFLAYGGEVRFNRQLSQRTAVQADYGYRIRESSEAIRGRFSHQNVGARLTYTLGKGLAARAGYHYVEALYGPSSGNFTQHLIDAGVDYSRNLSFSRRTSLSFSTGTTATTSPGESSTGNRFRANGAVTLSHELGRTWSAALNYTRGVFFSEAWPEPLSADTVTASLGGLFTRRVQFHSRAHALAGRLGFRDGAGGFDRYHGNVGLGYALSRYASLAVSYTYSHQQFDRAALLFPDFSNRLERHSVRGSLNVWVPLITKSRSRDATR
ncbi:MAG: hypothetical protein ACT4QD_14610 [Acidobacteriota bacterium]